MDFRYLQGMHFPQKYHNRPQGRPNEKEFELFSNTKISFTKVGTETEDKKIESSFHGFHTFWVGHHTFLKYRHPENTKNNYCLVQ